MLDKWLTKEAEDQSLDSHPTPVEVAYAPPNPDGSRKKCGNCWKFVTGGTCLEVAGKINPTDVCNYYIFGKPRSSSAPGIPNKLSAKDAGLVSTRDGSSCDTCKAHRDTICIRVHKDGSPAKVQPKGCCNAWQEVK